MGPSPKTIELRAEKIQEIEGSSELYENRIYSLSTHLEAAFEQFIASFEYN